MIKFLFFYIFMNMYLCPPAGMWLKIAIVFREKGSPSEDVRSNAVYLTTRVTSPAGCSQLYLKFSAEFTRGLIANLLAIAGVFACKLHSFLPAKLSFLLTNNGRVCMSSAWKLSVKYLLFSVNFTCSCKKVSDVLREVLAV